MTKDEIINKQSKMIRDLISVGMQRYQEITDLFVEIEKQRGIKEEEIEKIGIIDDHKIILINRSKAEVPKRICEDTQIVVNKTSSEKPKKLCPRCRENYRLVLKSGRVTSYCTQCNTEKAKEKRNKKISESLGQNSTGVETVMRAFGEKF